MPSCSQRSRSPHTLRFAESETVWKRITVPVAGGPGGLLGELIFDLPDGVGRESFSQVLEAEQRALEAEYRRTHKPPDVNDMRAFAERVQARLDAMGEQ